MALLLLEFLETAVNRYTSQNRSFFWSELVLAAFKEAGIRLALGQPSEQSPEGMVRAYVARELQHVGHVVARP